MDEKNSEALVKMVNVYIGMLDRFVDPPKVVFLRNPKIRRSMNQQLAQDIEPIDEKNLQYFDEHPLILSKNQVQLVLKSSMDTELQAINFNLLLFGLFMAEELNQNVNDLEEIHRRNELVFAILPYAKELKSNILNLYPK
jgi:hypothetical protein